MHTGGLAGPCESQSCLCACCANVNVSSNCSVAPIIACEYRRPGRQRRRLNMLCFACFRMLPHLHNSCESQYPPSDPSLPIHANLNLRSPTPYIALCESRVPHSPSDLCEFQTRDSQIVRMSTHASPFNTCECQSTHFPPQSAHANVGAKGNALPCLCDLQRTFDDMPHWSCCSSRRLAISRCLACSSLPAFCSTCSSFFFFAVRASSMACGHVNFPLKVHLCPVLP